eukprot:5003064-Amphidinium_carterae.1
MVEQQNAHLSVDTRERESPQPGRLRGTVPAKLTTYRSPKPCPVVKMLKWHSMQYQRYFLSDLYAVTLKPRTSNKSEHNAEPKGPSYPGCPQIAPLHCSTCY